MQAGRGFGKTRLGAEWVLEQVRTGKAKRIALIAPTAADARDVMVEGESGVLSVARDDERPLYEPSKRRLTFPNGAVAATYSADEPERLRGPQHDCLWADEPASWRRPETWDMAMFGLRLGQDPRALVTGTPKPVKLIRELRALETTVVTRGRTLDNAANLAPQFLDSIVAKYQGTRLGRQELEGELLDDVPGALWTRGMFDVKLSEAPQLERIVIGVDPAVTSGEDSDETGIVVVGRGVDGRGYVLGDHSGRYTPMAWADTVANVFSLHKADRVVAEVNNGGDLVEMTLRSVAPNIPYKKVHASRGKRVRAEPIAALYEQGRVTHLQGLEVLEDQLCTFVPDMQGSPDRMDACFVAGTLITTDKGEVPIEDVRPGMMVLTRQGYRPVKRAEMTAQDVPVLILETSDGRDLVGTANHPVFVQDKGFVPLDTLVWDDILITCPTRQSYSTASSLPAILSPHSEVRESTSTLTRNTGLRVSKAYTKRFGKLITALSLPGIKSTTKTAIRSIMTSPTSSLSRPKSTASYTPKSLGTQGESTLTASGLWRLRGMALPRAAQSIVGLAKRAGMVGRRLLESARYAAQSLKPTTLTPAFAHELVSTDTPRQDAKIMKSGNVSLAAVTSRHDAPNQTKPVPVSAAGLYDGGRASVYNLEVEDVHEYFANGILVHNCVWALSELMLEPEIKRRQSSFSFSTL